MIIEETVKELAYLLWMNEGCPEGKDIEFYFSALQMLETAEYQVAVKAVIKKEEQKYRNVKMMPEKKIIQGFIKNFDGEKAVIDCCADRKIIYLMRSDMPKNAHVGDFIVYCKIKNQYYIDFEITQLRKQSLQRQCDSYFG